MRINLRLVLRTLAVIAATSIILYSFSYSSSAYKALNQHLSALNSFRGRPSADSPAINTTLPPVKSVEALWAVWSDVYERARPHTSKIELTGQAPNIPLSEDDVSPRTQVTQRVENGRADIDALHSAHAALLKQLKSWPEDAAEGVYDGKGVVMVGGGEYFGPAIIGIHMLRRSGSDLPIQVFVADESEWEPKLCDEYLPKIGAQCLIISDFVAGFKVTHYQLKSLAMLLSSFAEVLYLDSDSIPLVDPDTELFAKDPYLSTGLIIWPDFWIASESPSFYDVVGLSGLPSNLPKSSSEAGQLLIDKRRHLKTLLLANYYNIYGPNYYYPLLSQGALGQGDKETFLAAALVLDVPWYRVTKGVESVGRNNGFEEKGSGMIQFNPVDDLNHSEDDTTHIRAAFVHANTPKMNAGHLIDEGDLVTINGDQTRLRLWGPEDEQIERFGIDLEKSVWELVLQTGCELAHVIREWTSRDRMCERLQEHWDTVFHDEDEHS